MSFQRKKIDKIVKIIIYLPQNNQLFSVNFSTQDSYFVFPTATILAPLIHEEVKYYFFIKIRKIKALWGAEKEKKL